MMFARVGHDVVFSEGWNRTRAEAFVRRAGGNARVGIAGEADVLLTDLPAARLSSALEGCAAPRGRIIITCAYAAGSVQLPFELEGQRVVAAFDGIVDADLCPAFHARERGGGPPIEVYGVDASARSTAHRLVGEVGFTPLDTGAMIRRTTQVSKGALVAVPTPSPDGTTKIAYRFEPIIGWKGSKC